MGEIHLEWRFEVLVVRRCAKIIVIITSNYLALLCIPVLRNLHKELSSHDSQSSRRSLHPSMHKSRDPSFLHELYGPDTQ